MGWLTGPALTAVLFAAFVVYIYDHVFVAGAHSLLTGIVRACLAVGVGTSVITVSLLRNFDASTRWFRRGSKEVGKPAKSLRRIKRFW